MTPQPTPQQLPSSITEVYVHSGCCDLDGQEVTVDTPVDRDGGYYLASRPHCAVGRHELRYQGSRPTHPRS